LPSVMMKVTGLQMVKRQQSSLSRHSILSTQGMHYMAFQPQGNDPSAPEMHLPLLSELQELQDAVEIVAHVAHAVAVKQLDITDAPAPLYGSENQDLSTRSRNSSQPHQSAFGATRPLSTPSPAPVATLGLEAQPSLVAAGKTGPGSHSQETPPQPVDSLVGSGPTVVTVLAQDDAAALGGNDAKGVTVDIMVTQHVSDTVGAGGMDTTCGVVGAGKGAAQGVPPLLGREGHIQTSLAASKIYDAAADVAAMSGSLVSTGTSPAGPSPPSSHTGGEVEVTALGLLLAEGESAEVVMSEEFGLRNAVSAAQPGLPATEVGLSTWSLPREPSIKFDLTLTTL